MTTTENTTSAIPDWTITLADVLKRLPSYLKLGWALARSPEIPNRHKRLLLGGVLYAVSPVDLVPGFIPVLGQLDDLAMLLWGIRSALRHCPSPVAAYLLDDCGLTKQQLDEDLRALGKIAKGFSSTVVKGAYRGSRVVGKAVGRGLASGARSLWMAYHRQRGTR